MVDYIILTFLISVSGLYVFLQWVRYINFKDISIVTGKKAKNMIKGSEKYDSLSKVLKSSDKYFESISKKGFLDFSPSQLGIGLGFFLLF